MTDFDITAVDVNCVYMANVTDVNISDETDVNMTLRCDRSL